MAFDRIKKAIMLKAKKECSQSVVEKCENDSKPEEKVMHRFELKHIAELFRKSSSTKEEKTPIVNKSAKVPDSGSIAKELNMSGTFDSKASFGHRRLGSESDSCEEESDVPPKMTLLRKLCFFLSLNGGVMYVAAFLWWIPCRSPMCMPSQNWTLNFSYPLTSNIEVKSSGLSPSMFFGYTDEDGGKLASLAVMNGTMAWNRSAENILRHVFCDLQTPFSANNKNIPDCIATSYEYVEAFRASDGHLLWEQNLTNPYEQTIHKVELVGNSSTGIYIVGISEEYVYLMDAKTGKLMLATDLPCSWTIDVKLVGPWPTENGTLWTLVCEYGESLEVWTFREEELLKPPQEPDRPNDVEFHLLFSRESNVGSIDLAGDVTRTPSSLALSWADIVVMVTDQAPFHHLHETWERRFTGLHGDSLAVTGIVFGRFTDSAEVQIAVAVQNELNSTLHILESKNGTSEFVTSLGMRSVMSLQKISGTSDDVDTIVIESIPLLNKEKNISESEYSESFPKSTTREYFTAKYTKKSMVFETIVKSEVYASTLSSFAEGVADLLIASRSPDYDSVISRYVLTSKLLEICD